MEFDAVGSKMFAGEDWGEAVMVIDGKSTWIYVKGLNQYQVTSGAPPDHDSLLNPKHGPGHILCRPRWAILWEAINTFRAPARQRFCVKKPSNLNGVLTNCYVVEVSNASMVERLWIDKNRYLVVREDSMDPAETSSTVFTALHDK